MLAVAPDQCERSDLYDLVVGRSLGIWLAVPPTCDHDQQSIGQADACWWSETRVRRWQECERAQRSSRRRRLQHRGGIKRPHSQDIADCNGVVLVLSGVAEPSNFHALRSSEPVQGLPRTVSPVGNTVFTLGCRDCQAQVNWRERLLNGVRTSTTRYSTRL
jgi:hypothetical protein